MTTFLKQGTKRAESLINSYDASVRYYGYRDLWDCYTRPSLTKESIYDSIRNECYNELEGYGYTILSANTFQFSCAFIYPDSETGALILRVYTRDNCYETWYV